MPKGCYKRTEEHRKRISEGTKIAMASMPDEKRNAIRNARIGTTPWNKNKVGVYSEEQLQNIKNGTLEAMAKPEVKEKYIAAMKKLDYMSIAQKGNITKANWSIEQQNRYKELVSKAHKGTKITDETKEKMQLSRYKFLEQCGVSKETCKKISLSMQGNKHPMFGKPAAKLSGTGKMGFRKDIGLFVRSTWEANFARILKFNSVEFEYESERFNVVLPNGNECSYCPDFKIGDVRFELKGYVGRPEWQIKYHSFLQQHPHIKLVVITSKRYHKLLKKYSNRIVFE